MRSCQFPLPLCRPHADLTQPRQSSDVACHRFAARADAAVARARGADVGAEQRGKQVEEGEMSPSCVEFSE